MSRGTSCLRGIDQKTWKHGFMFWDTTELKTRGRYGYAHAEICVMFKESQITVFAKVAQAHLEKRRYDISLFHDEECASATLSARVDYVDQFSSTADIELVTRIGRFPATLAAPLLEAVHPLIVSDLISRWEKMGCFYDPFTRADITKLEYFSKADLQRLTARMQEHFPGECPSP